MKLPSEAGPPLSMHRASVVQLQSEANVEKGRVMGRVEHVALGQATHFDTLEELLAFMARVLTHPDTEPPEEV